MATIYPLRDPKRVASRTSEWTFLLVQLTSRIFPLRDGTILSPPTPESNFRSLSKCLSTLLALTLGHPLDAVLSWLLGLGLEGVEQGSLSRNLTPYWQPKRPGSPACWILPFPGPNWGVSCSGTPQKGGSPCASRLKPTLPSKNQTHTLFRTA